tara:strand:+ start:250 stop:771 length:522 start_codon:yes stop_codon:yes gene_type:complete
MNLFKKISYFLRDYKFSRIYLAIVLLLANIYLLATAAIYPANLIGSSVLSIFLMMFVLSNTKKKLDAQLLDKGIMIKPFFGMPVMQLLNGPGSIVQKTPDIPEAPVSLVNWVYFCVLAISRSNEEKYHYHQHLISAVKANCPDLLPWIPEMYRELKETPPLPDEISMEDFNES